MVPTAASEYFEFAAGWPGGVLHIHYGIRCEPIAAPFPNVPVHVVQSPWIGTLLANWMRRAFAVFQCPGVLIRFGGCVAEAEKISRSCSTGIFPLRFGRKPVGVARRKPPRHFFTFGDSRTIGHGVE